MSKRLYFCKICGKKLASQNGLSGHMRIHSASSLSHDCKICGKKFATSKSLCNHKRIHSGQRNRLMVDENEFLFLLWIWALGFESSSSLSETEEDEMNEAAMSLVMFSQQVYDFPPSSADIIMDLEVKPMQENILHCTELVSQSKSSTCSDVVAHAVPSSLKSDLLRKLKNKSSYKCKICGKSFVCSQALGSHQRVHRSTSKGQLAPKKEDFEVSQEGLTELRYTTVKEHCVVSKEEFGELLPSLLRCKLQEKTKSDLSRICRICGKTFRCYQALGGHQRVHRGQLARKTEDLEGGNSLSGLSEAKASFEVSQEELIELRDTNVKEHCVEAKQDFSEVDIDKSSDVFVGQALLLPSPIQSELQRKPASNSSRVCRICGKTFWCYQALGGHLKHRRCQISRERMILKDGSSLSDLPEAKKIFFTRIKF